MNCPCAHSIGASIAAAIMQRIAVAHNGDTSCTIILVTGQLVPHASTTPASSAAALRVESPLAISNTSFISRPGLPSLPTGSKERTSFFELTGPVVDDLLPGMLHLSRQAGDTLTRQLTDQLRELITKGALAPGQRLPSSRQLAQSLALSRNTVAFAIEQLAAEGYLALSAGRRPVVAAGLSLDRRRTSSRSHRADSARISLSAWARSLHRANWPPVHDGRPRPFQPGLADEREFPHEVWSRCLRRAARNAPLRRDRPINHPPLQEALLGHLVVHRGI